MSWRSTFLLILFGWRLGNACAQTDQLERNIAALPPAFQSLKDDRQRALFLKHLVVDSLTAERYQPVIGWARLGYSIARRAGMDTIKGSFLKYIGEVYSYHYVQPDSAISYYKAAISYFPEKTGKDHIFLAGEILNNYSDAGKKDSCFVYLNYIQTIMEGMPDTAAAKISLAKIIAGVYGDYGMFEKAIRYYQFALEGCLRNKDKDQMGLVLVNLGLVYNELQNDKKAIRFTKESLQYMDGHRQRQIKTCANLAAYYCNLALYDSAKYFLEKSNALARESNDSSDLQTNATRLASIYTKERHFDKAKQILENSLAFFRNQSDHFGVIKTLFYLSELDSTRHNYTSAKKYLEEAADMSRQAGNKVYLSIALQDLTNVAGAMGDYKGALAYQQEFMNNKDSIDREQGKDNLYEMEISYKTQQKEQQIQLLTRDNRIKNLQLQDNRRSILFYGIALVAVGGVISILLFQRNLRNKIKQSKIKAELETKVLRAQMNPHFIFNSLNSIENFMMKNNKRMASDYFGKFATLMRMILDSSRNELMLFSRDLEALQLYVELEQLRFNNKFLYETSIDPLLMNGDYRVPPLLIQPYVENAIIHGLGQSEREGLKLEVGAGLQGEYIVYTIRDNGIGRERSKEYKQEKRLDYKSVGMELTQERIELFNAQQHTHGNVTITDLYDDGREPAGTLVEVKIKAV